MKRLVAALAALLFVALAVAPAVLAADPNLPHSGRVLFAAQGDVTVGPGEQADLVIVAQGTARISGQVNTIVVLDGRADLSNATTETLVAVRSPVELGAGTHVLGNVHTLDSLVHRTGNAAVDGDIRDLAGDVAGLGIILAPALFLIYVGFALAAVVGGLVLAALGARQVRAAEALISHEPGSTLVAAIVGIFVPLLVVALLAVSIVGIPLAIALAVAVWPAVALVGYLIAGIWIGDLILARTNPTVKRERPYLAAVIGIVILHALSIWPPIGAIASLFGYGAVLLLAWRTFRHHGAGDPISTRAPQTRPMPMPG